jgi:hypothetical protein
MRVQSGGLPVDCQIPTRACSRFQLASEGQAASAALFAKRAG